MAANIIRGEVMKMSRNELIDDVVRVFYEGGNWNKYLKQLVREQNKSEYVHNILLKYGRGNENVYSN